ncbi:WGR domain-containing protein [Catenulispora acidiphila DSM 44928]|uniref:WGR domain-containing protein n=1 Tax=Catenulispora acidiphila (strain DSM 44928 / JCM 14897 / NBRC 102108 / NRRL B-24433 / ID139908) TaxID=479433 RepID=C7PYX9_CATAD|nr:DUF4132 domain-containing protein [Catenulispora acidiphila]ACU69535.1 WGR domain-containing protein [Catenulispora acidiphila DSM 44928]
MRAGRALTSTDQDSEDVFELPDSYQSATPWVRERKRPPEALVFDERAALLLERRRRDRADCQEVVDDALRTDAHRIADPVGVMQGVDCTDLGSQTPRQAALVASILNPLHSRELSLIDLWCETHGPAFALAAFVEYCHLTSLRERDLIGRLRWEVLRLLEFVRSVPDEDRDEAVAAAQRLREDEPTAVTRMLTTLLFPERPAWFWADLAAAADGKLDPCALLPSATTVDQASALAEQLLAQPGWSWHDDHAIERTFLAVAGSTALPFLVAWSETGHECPYRDSGNLRQCRIHRTCLDLISRIPTEAAMSVLIRWLGRDGVVSEYLQAAIKRFPRRALRLLAETEATEEITRLLTMVVLADPGFARTEAPRLSPEARDRIEALLGGGTPDAAPVDLPEILAAPPWRDKKRKRGKPVVVDGVEGLTPPAEVTVAWLPGEREAWLAKPGAGWVPEQGWNSILADIAEEEGRESLATYFAAYAPDDLVRAQLAAGWRPPMRQVTDRVRTFVAKHELFVLPMVLSLNRFPAMRAQLLQPFASAEIAAIMADGLVRLRTVHASATAWLRRHPDDAVRGLVPAAVGKPGKARQNAVTALRWLDADGIDVVALAQQEYGEDVATATKEVLADRGFETYPRTVPETPLWARAVLLSDIRLKDGQTALPHSAVQAVVEMLMFSKPDAPYAGLEVVAEICDASSLAEFVWSLHGLWAQSGSHESERWVVGALGIFGDQTTVAQLEQLIRDWYRDPKLDLVVAGFDALAAIGGDRALTALNGFARRSWTGMLKRKAQATFEDVAASMDLTPDRLADRLVPTSGLTAEATFQLDYGRRRFDVSFDELLRPVVRDETGTVLRTLPKPGKRDDAELAAASFKRFVTLNRQVQDGTQEQIARMERAMLERRRWTPEDFATYLVRHLVLGRLVRRLVWGVYAEDRRLLGSFRVAEDLSFADVDDARYEIPDGASIGVAHPVDLGLAVTRWSEVFSDYEILQPFDQLGRPPLALTAEELSGTCLVRPYITQKVPGGVRTAGEIRFGGVKFAGLMSRGWQPGPIGAGQVWSRLLRPVGEGRYMVVDLDPGLPAGAVVMANPQAVEAVWLSATGDEPDFARHALPLSDLDAVTASVILRDLEEGT